METRYGVGKLKVPDGFAGMLERFAREVLRKQPLNIAEFGAEYFQEQLRKRDDTGFDQMTHDIDVEKRRYNDEHFGTKGDYPLKESNKEERAAVKIQAGYRGFKGRRKVEHLKEERELEHAAVKIQANFKGYKTRRELKNKDNVEDVEKAKEENAALPEEVAATQIQSTFRGHQTRKNIQSEREQHAATKIQAQFRGHQTRKQYSKQENEDKREEEVMVIQGGGGILTQEEYAMEHEEEESKVLKQGSLPMNQYEIKEEEEVMVMRGSLAQEEYEMTHEEEESKVLKQGSLATEEHEMKEEAEVTDKKLKENVVIQNVKVDDALTAAEEEDVQATNDEKLEEEEDRLDKLKRELEEATSGVKDEEEQRDEKGRVDEMDAKATTDVLEAGDAPVQDDKTLHIEDNEKHKAATQIQSHYRGYRARKEYPQKQYAAKKEKSGDAV